jgi:outer membrane protein assembly factor BamE (lipoprotein component of BamABCDE complex)
MRRMKSRAHAVLAAILLAGLCACATVGPTSITQGRTPYNEVIHDTSSQQTLLNLVRVYNNEPPLFMDVTEVDAATSLAGTIGGGASNLGATANYKSTSAGTISGAVGSVSGSAQYQEAPTVRYQPLSGQALIAQISTPISPENLVNALNSVWDPAAVLTFSTNALTGGQSDYGAALNAIIDLENYDALIFAATQSSGKASKGATQDKSTTPDQLTIYYEPNQISISHSVCDVNFPGGKNAVTRPTDKEEQSEARRIVKSLWDRLKTIYGPEYINDKALTLPIKGSKTIRPLLQTATAIGVMRSAALHEGIYFKDPDSIRSIIDKYHLRDKSRGCDDQFYTVDPKLDQAFAQSQGEKPALNEDVAQKQGEQAALNSEDIAAYTAISNRLDRDKLSMATMYPEQWHSSFEEKKTEVFVMNARQFVLIAKSADPPEDAFVSVYHDGYWYYIFKGDYISKDNLALISYISTMQAVPSQNPPLTPSLSVGAR